MNNLPCTDCGTTRRKTRIVNGDSVCFLCEGDRGEKLSLFYPRKSDNGPWTQGEINMPVSRITPNIDLIDPIEVEG